MMPLMKTDDLEANFGQPSLNIAPGPAQSPFLKLRRANALFPSFLENSIRFHQKQGPKNKFVSNN